MKMVAFGTGCPSESVTLPTRSKPDGLTTKSIAADAAALLWVEDANPEGLGDREMTAML